MALKIDSYRFGEVVVAGQAYHKDVIIFPDRILANWRRADGHSLCLADLEAVLENPPAVLVLGQGAYGRMVVPAAVQDQLSAQGVQVYAQPTSAACDLYNNLRGARSVVAALHLTC